MKHDPACTLSCPPAMTLFPLKWPREAAALAIGRMAYALFYVAVFGLCVALPVALLTWIVRMLVG